MIEKHYQKAKKIILLKLKNILKKGTSFIFY